ncbi:MAG TPA: nucleotide-binding protein [Pyrinomonadaceae bacterium]|nr:nucleotide-binding protein [Pyrinomonadaceae bacterium]
MGKASVFIGSSKEGLDVARAIGDGIECCADPIIWDEGVFEFGRSYLEELVAEIEKHDFAILVLTADDVTESRGDSKQSPRDNVLFELGLFMGKLGRERTFIVCDENTAQMKLPSDLSGISLITYEGARMADAAASAVRGACMRINRVIKKPPLRELSGIWKSRYLLCHGEGKGGGLVHEDVEIAPARGMLRIESKVNDKNDKYVAYGRLVSCRHIVGDWKSTRLAATAGGAFFLTVHPYGNLMYGYFVSPGDDNKVTHGGWVMARFGPGDVIAQRESLGANGAAKGAASSNGGAAQSESDEERLKRVVDEKLNELLDDGVRLLKNSAPILDALDDRPETADARASAPAASAPEHV